MPLQDRFIFRFGFILTVIFISLILVNPRQSFAGDATQVIREYDPDDYIPVDATDVRKAAEQGNAFAQCKLGFMYGIGRGVPQDYKEAARWFREAAEQGNAFAQYNLGVMYDKGQGVSQDYKEAARWYHKAVEHGNAFAQYNLGVMYDKGQGVSQDYKEAARWYHKAVEHGER